MLYQHSKLLVIKTNWFKTREINWHELPFKLTCICKTKTGIDIIAHHTRQIKQDLARKQYILHSIMR